MAEELLITEFLYFLADPAAVEREPAFHVNTQIVSTNDAGQRFFAPVRQLNMEQAQAEGLTLPVILGALDTVSAARIVVLAGQVEALTAERDQLLDQASAARAALDVARAQLQALLDAASPAPGEGDAPAEE